MHFWRNPDEERDGKVGGCICSVFFFCRFNRDCTTKVSPVQMVFVRLILTGVLRSSGKGRTDAFVCQALSPRVISDVGYGL